MQRKISRLAGLLVTIVVVSAPAFHGLRFEEVLARMDLTNAVRQAVATVDVAKGALTLLTHPGGRGSQQHLHFHDLDCPGQ